MKVLKFGGSSVGSAKGLSQVRSIVADCDEEVIVIVSALKGVTDKLIEIADMAVVADEMFREELMSMEQMHMNLVDESVMAAMLEPTKERVEKLFADLRNIFQGIYLIRDLSQKTSDTILSYGERLSASIVSGVIEGATYVDARKIIKTRPYYGKHVINFEESDKLIVERFKELPQISVVPGFIATDSISGDVTTLGRGGSDYTASVIAAALMASKLEIWTDVDGFMTADPKMVPSAYVIEQLSYNEAMELSNFGAKVIYPPTIFPAYNKRIPIIVKNTYNLDSPGTFISESVANQNEKPIRGVSSLNDTSLITVQGLGMVGVIGVNYRIFKALAKAGISVFLVSQAASENSISIGLLTEYADLAIEVLNEEFTVEISQGEIKEMQCQRGLATIAIVGEHMKNRPGVAGKLFDTLGSNGINVVSTAQGASEINISIVIELNNLRKAVNVIHDSFFLSEYQQLNVFITGIGLVGSNLLEQIEMQQPKLLEDNALQVKVVGVANSKKMLFDKEGIDLRNYKEQLAKNGIDSTPEEVKDRIVDLNIFNSVFVDCTASEEVSAIYKDLLEHNISVVAANKVAASSKYEVYEELKLTAKRNGVKFLFETNAGAGLPIINTINDLINSGDKILKIEAVLSGTLNFIFNEMSEAIPFSETIRLAQEAGYAEPDPRIDLDGTDVVRKLVILSREAGYKVNQEDVEKKLFVPERYFSGSVDDFWNTISEMDGEFEERRKRLTEKGLRLRFVATMDHGKTKVELQEVDSSSPFYDLAGSNNVISLTTDRYREYPMQIKGYGAGAGVTAAGVFADIISVANIR